MLKKKIIIRRDEFIDKFRIIFLASTVLIFIFSIFLTVPRVKNTLLPQPTDKPQIEVFTEKGCIVTGCNGEICANDTDEGVASNCMYKEEYICYQTARCEKQEDGKCNWTQSEELITCLGNKKAKGTEFE